MLTSIASLHIVCYIVIMEIYISNLHDVPNMIHMHDITHVLTLLRGKEANQLVLPSTFNRKNWLFLDMDDVINQQAEMAPTIEQVQEILNWSKNLPTSSKLLVHCYAGVSRSTAAALSIKVQQLGINRIQDAINWLVDHRPIACPNPLITKYADNLLNANGKLHSAAEKVAGAKLFKIYGNRIENRNHLKE